MLIRRRKQNIAAKMQRSRRFRTHGARITTDITAVVVIVLVVLAIVYRHEITIENIVNFTPSNLWLAALVFLLLYAVKSLTAVVYVKLLYVAAGLVFPLPVAILVNLAGTAVQLALPYTLGRAGGRELADATVKRYPKLGRISALRQRSNFWFSAFVRAVGLFPADPVSMYFGACCMPFVDFLLGSTAGILPTLLISTVIGTSADDPGSAGFIISVILFVLVQLGSAVGFWIWIRKNNAALAAAAKEKASDESSQ